MITKKEHIKDRTILPEQIELHPGLPVVIGNTDYQEFERRRIRINEMLCLSGIEVRCIEGSHAFWALLCLVCFTQNFLIFHAIEGLRCI